MRKIINGIVILLLTAGSVWAADPAYEIGSGSIMSSPPAIGAIAPNTGKFTTLDATGDFKVSGHSSLDSADFVGDVHTSNASTATFDGPVIITGAFDYVGLTQGTIDNVDIGQVAPGKGKFTTLEATGGITGNLTGNASGTASNVTGTVAAANGGVPTTTKGDLAGYSTTNARIPVGTDGQVLTADSTQALGLKWAAGGGGGGGTYATGVLALTDCTTTPTQVVTVGFTPALVNFVAALGNSTASIGTDNAAGTYWREHIQGGVFTIDTTQALSVATLGASNCQGHITSTTSTSFTVTFTGTGTGAWKLAYAAFK